MIRTMIILLLYYCLLGSLNVRAQNLIGLRAASNLSGILFGTAVDVVNLQQNYDQKQYNASILANYQLIVPENELKPKAIWMGENQYNWVEADYLLGGPNFTGWVQNNSMRIKGHNLVWGYDEKIPQWLLAHEPNITSDKALQLLSDYVHTVVTRYRGKLISWDVANEVLEDANNTRPLNIRDSFWFRKLGVDYIKYAYQFAQEADPDVPLYYNDFNIETVGLKATRTIELAKWLRSQGATVHGIGLEYHIDVSTNFTPGDGHYQIAQQFIDNNLDFMVTELDIPIPTIGGYPSNLQDLETQATIYRSILEFCLHFSSNCKAMLTWGFTDRFSWIPSYRYYHAGDALPLDWLYRPKPAYWQMLEVMARVIDDGIYRLSPQSEPNKCLGTSQNVTSNDVQLYSDDCNNAYEKWKIVWQGDGCYTFSPESNGNRVLGAYNTTASIGGVQMYNWTGDVNQEWAFSAQGNNSYRVVPRTAWWRVMTVYGSSDNIDIIDPNGTAAQNWIITKV